MISRRSAGLSERNAQRRNGLLRPRPLGGHPFRHEQTVQNCLKCRRDLRTADFTSACRELVSRVSDAFGLRCLKRCLRLARTSSQVAISDIRGKGRSAHARRYDRSCTPAIITARAAKASRVPSCSPFSKSSPACPMVLVTWARQSTRTPAERANE